MITVSPNAASALRDLLLRKSAGEGAGLRLLVQKGGCAGLQYAMKVDVPKPGDTIAGDAGARVIIDPESLPYLDNCEIDFNDGLTDAGFKITNPNAARSCGCGSSFEPSGQPLAPPPPVDPSANAVPCPGDSA